MLNRAMGAGIGFVARPQRFQCRSGALKRDYEESLAAKEKAEEEIKDFHQKRKGMHFAGDVNGHVPYETR